MTAETALFKNKQYRLLFKASSISNLGDGIALLAFPWLASMISREAEQIAWVTAALRLPWLIFSLPAGLAADRIDRRQLILWADFLRLIVLFVLVLALWFLPELDALPEAQASQLMLVVAAAAFALGSAEVFRDNTAQTLLPAVVHASQLEKANGQMWSAEQLMGQFVGPPLAGFLILLSVEASFAADFICILLAFYCVYAMRLPSRVAPHNSLGMGQQIMEGLRWLYGHALLLRLALMLGVANFVATGAITVLVLYSQEVLQLSAAEHGVLLTAGAVGGVVGGVLCPSIIKKIGSQRSLWVALFLFVVPFAVIAVTDSVLWVAVALFVEMFAALLWNVVTVSLRQRVIPDHLLGRVNSVYRLLGWGAMPLGALAAGYLVAYAEIFMIREQALRLPYAVSAAMMFCLFLYGLLRLRVEPSE